MPQPALDKTPVMKSSLGKSKTRVNPTAVTQHAQTVRDSRLQVKALVIMALDLDRAILIMILISKGFLPYKWWHMLKMPTTQGRHANEENGLITPRGLTGLMEVIRHPIAGIKGETRIPGLK